MPDDRHHVPPQLRVARQTARLDAVVAFYRDGLDPDGCHVVLVPGRWQA